MTAVVLLERVEALRRAEPAEALAVLEKGFAVAVRKADATSRGMLWRTRAHMLRALSRTRESATCYAHAARWFAEDGKERE